MSPAPDSNRVAIIGAGLIGLSAAWRLSQYGYQVAVFEKSIAGREASWAGAGMLAPGGEFTGASQLATLSVESRRLYGSFVQELTKLSGVEIDYQECGALDLAYSDEDWEHLQARASAQAAIGIQSKAVSTDRIAVFWPRVRRDGLKGALFYPNDGIVNPRDLVSALVVACQKTGVSLHENAEVKSVSASKTKLQVNTAAEEFVTDYAVLAAGAWSSTIPLTGVDPVPEARPVKGQLLGYQQPDQTCNTIIRHGESYLLQRANGTLIVGASVENAGFDRSIDSLRSSELAEAAGFVLPHLAETTPSESWIGFRPGADSLQLGRWQSPRLHLAYGHYRNGILLAPVTASKIVDSISASWETS